MSAQRYSVPCQPGRAARKSWDFFWKLPASAHQRLYEVGNAMSCATGRYTGALPVSGAKISCRMESPFSSRSLAKTGISSNTTNRPAFGWRLTQKEIRCLNIGSSARNEP